ncbi:glycosyltransferase family 87 protein [Propionibacteriaceae bacterium G1746]|uniref:glycosyltransferase family 87 protein n=1 Tax=Aestuariimicrobium sp. G57 TaxID=3418485 RepID=UPI003C1BB028
MSTGPVVLVALVVLPLVIEGGTLWPWAPRTPQLDVMRWVAGELVSGRAPLGDDQRVDYPWTPFGALLMAPLALLTPVLWQLLLTALSASAVQSLLRRLFGLTGLRLVVAGCLAVLLIEPVRMALGVGQVSVLLVWVVVVDLVVPHPHADMALRRRVLPQGTLTGVVAAIALPVLWVPLAMLSAGRRRVALTTFGAAAACLVVGWMVARGQSEAMLEPAGALPSNWLQVDNQSLVAALVRVGSPAQLAQVFAVVVAVVAAWAAARWWGHDPVLGLGLALTAALAPQDPGWTWGMTGTLVVAAGLWTARAKVHPWVLTTGATWVLWTWVGLPQVLLAGVPADGSGAAAQLLSGVGAVLLVAFVVCSAVFVPTRSTTR